MEELPTLDAPESWVASSGRTVVLARGSSVDRYIVVDKLGAGGMGIVYSAYDPDLDRRVAIKIIKPVGVDSTRASEIRERTTREARGMAQLAHPNVVGIYDVGTFNDSMFLAMELVEGASLKAWLGSKRSSAAIIEKFLDAGRGLAAAHARGLVHRDFKPENVMVDSKGRARVTDFGLVRDLAGPADDELESSLSGAGLGSGDPRLTQTGAYLGTPNYMAPEQFAAKPADERADQFSYSVALFEALFAAHPYPAKTFGGRMKVFQEGTAATVPNESTVSSRIEKALLRGLSLDPDDRFPTMDALLEELSPRAQAGTGKRALSLGLGLVVAVSGALTYRSVVDDTSVCQGAERRLSAVWNLDRASKLSESFGRVGGTNRALSSFSKNAAERVVRAFDVYGAKWSGARIEACEATQKYREQTEAVMQLRMQCLDRRLGDLDALADTLLRTGNSTDTNTALVRGSVAAANELESIEGCSDVDALSSEGLLPADPVKRVEVEKMDPLFSRLRGLHLAGRYGEGDELAREVLALATESNYRPSQARAHFWAAKFASSNSQFEVAKNHLDEGVWFAEAVGNDVLSADLWIEHLVVLGRARASLASLPTLERRASAAVERLQRPADLITRYSSALGSIANEDGRFDDAIKLFGDALKSVEAGNKARTLGHAAVLSGLGGAEMEVDKFEQALVHLKGALAIQEQILGPMHPQVAKTLSKLGATNGVMGNVDPAIAAYRRAIEIVQSSLGPDHPEMATLQAGLAAELLGGGKADESLPLFNEALQRMIKLHGENSKFVSRLLNNRGIALRILDRPLDSQADLLRALAILKQVGDEASIGNAFANVGDSYLATDDTSKAAEYFRKAVKAMLATYGPESLKTAYSIHGLGTAFMGAKNFRGAITEFEEALRIRKLGRDRPKRIASAQNSLAQALVASGERERGCELFRVAENGYRLIGSERYLRAADEIASDRKKAGCR